MIAFMNSFFSYLLLFIVMAVIAGTGIFVGIAVRKKKNLQAQAAGTEEEVQ